MTRRDARAAAGIFAFTLLLFARLIFCDFTWWDDPQTIHHNPLLNPPTWASLGHYWTAMGPRSPMGLYVPVTYTVWWVLAWMAGMPATTDGIRLNPIMFHGVNVLLHATNAALVYVILRRLQIAFVRDASGSPSIARPEPRSRLGDSRDHDPASDSPTPSTDQAPSSTTDAALPSVFPALAGALLFAVHPVQVETIAWASGTKDLLCGLFTLIAVDRYVRFENSTGRVRSFNKFATFAAALFAMLSKPTGVIAPLLWVAVGRIALRRPWRSLLEQLSPMFVLMIGGALVARWSQPATFTSPVSVVSRPLVAADALFFYIRHLLWPIGLSPDYGRSPAFLQHEGVLYRGGVLSLLIVVTIPLLAWHYRARRLTLGLLLFALPLLPVLGLQPFLYQYHSTVTDHYLYLPMLGVGLMLAAVCATWTARAPKAVIVSLLLILSARTLLREPVWQNTRTLFADAVANDPETFGNFDMVGFTYAHEATQLARAGDPDAARRAATLAIDYYTEAIALNPGDVPARDNLARVEFNLGDRAAAVEQVRQIIRLQPRLSPDLRADPADLQRRLREYGGEPAHE